MTIKKTYFHGAYKLVLDSAEIHPNDPGAGAPAMVYCGKRSGTYGCVVDTGELEDLDLSESVLNWLYKMNDVVDLFIREHSPKA
jgi:hypothetical protein